MNNKFYLLTLLLLFSCESNETFESIIESNDIELIEYPFFDFNIHDICFLFNSDDLRIFKSLNKKVGKGFPVPKGSIFLMSL